MEGESTPKPESEPFSEPNAERETMMEISLSQEIGLSVMWLVALLAYGAAFKFYRAVLVLPNLIMQLILLIFTGILIGKSGLSYVLFLNHV